MSVLILSILVQVALIIHVVKTGRNQIWIWVLALLSLPGALAYIAVEILPELLGSRAAQRTARGLRQAVDPGRELRRYENEARVGGNVASRQRYAEELVRHERYEEAIGQYREALTGLYEHDPNLMLGLAQAQFGKGDASAARAPSYPGAEASVRYAQLLQAQGRRAEAQKVARELLEQARIAPGHYRRAQRPWLDAAQRLL